MQELKASLKHIFGFGFLVWLLPLVISFLIFPIQQSNLALFNTLMTLILVTTTIVFSILLLRQRFFPVVIAAVVGALWMVMGWGLDYLVLVRGPIQMPVDEYISGVGVEYLLIPLIIAAFSWWETYLRKKEEHV